MADLQVQKREASEKVNALREKGFIPVELYGKGVENLHLAVSGKEFKKVFKEAGESTIVNAVVGTKKYPVIIHDVSYDGITNDVLNIDLYQVRMDEKIKIMVPIEFIGISPAIKEKNGLLIKSIHELEVEALPMDIPHNFQIDISKITEIEQSLYVKDLNLPKGIKVLVDLETVIATVTAKLTEEEELAMEQAASVGVEGVKVESEEKKAEREAAKAAAEPATAAGTEASKTASKTEKK
jgi:large subunit ribosomal protein L25